MYVVTFYSFKGGVGRSMALANVAVELAQTGRRVLVVDFDLEAPGLDTLSLPHPKAHVPGVVEFVTQYIQTGESPDVAKFVYEADGVGRDGGRLWVMPAGIADDSYSSRLNAISWNDLYDRRDGYLLLEDLKEQWRSALSPDYVLIDSRTGHTDVGGICTRQLPDAVAILFVPNEQNLRGLEKVVRDVRGESSASRSKLIQLHFVLSNVPDIDDEDDILRNQLQRFERTLRIGSTLLTVHRYDSLLLLNQAIFTRDKPKSRLAREYRELADRIAASNSEDRAGALLFLQDRGVTNIAPAELDERLERIRNKHSGDPAILLALAKVRQRQRRMSEALDLLEGVVRAGMSMPDVVMMRAEVRHVLGDEAGATSDAILVLDDERSKFPDVDRAFRILRQSEPSSLATLATRKAVIGLQPGERLYIAGEMHSSRFELTQSRDIAAHLAENPDIETGVRMSARSEFAFSLIGLGEFPRAVRALETNFEARGFWTTQDAFNYAVARWGQDGLPTPSLFGRVLDHAAGPGHEQANYLQCMALANGIAGDTMKASSLLEQARVRAISQPGGVVSCWRYLFVKRDQFVADLSEMAAFFAKHAGVRPAIFL